ncbi:uroporphyrinogen-III C-methyltransferase [Aquibacillus koreensis]|uniref:Uroporphyrinogen-III C-methyltransferase n=1 Tax=Aquibacillus koreensis TaxID=279446 RepID=A0A9X4AI30_9BACI|nr:uroporphyrinogen-III C-methyltransferase [Aquibacillus koreensis]MCT2534228.1 uroporphyrinogen-III C-methyltransferase [Aquibacillus koreensis]MDC3420727.1 uroporphyrinogen-III C-methyltransferase [Aquibacillus koreensis]
MGMVYIVGAGPGDPDLITVKALKCIQKADVIFYDRLINRDLLKEAKADADLIYCGKLPKFHTMKQETINHLLVKYAMQGKTVTRLKGGDPFVYGRGAEEIEALAKKGIEYEVIPGITSGIAAPAYADIPITHRELGNSFAVVTGHCKKGKPTDIKWENLSKGVDTLAIYMGISNLPYICAQLTTHGKEKNTPVAIIQQGTTKQQRVVTGTLESIVGVVEKASIQNPAMIVVGEVVRFRHKINQLKIMNQRTPESGLLEAY